MKKILYFAAIVAVSLSLSSCEGWLHSVHSVKIQDSWDCNNATISIYAFSYDNLKDTIIALEDSVLEIDSADVKFDLDIDKEAIVTGKGVSCKYELVGDSLVCSPSVFPLYNALNEEAQALLPKQITSGMHTLLNMMILDHKIIIDSVPITVGDEVGGYLQLHLVESVGYISKTGNTLNTEE